MEFDIYNPSTWHLIKDDTVFYINGRDAYYIDFSSRIQIKDFLRLLQHNICLAEQKKKDFTESDRHQLITSILLNYYKNNTKEGVLEFYEKYDLYNVNDWEDFPDCPLVYENEILMSDEGKAIKARDFINFMRGIFNLLKKEVFDDSMKLKFDILLKRMLDTQNGLLEGEDGNNFILTSETEDKTPSGFNPYDESTYSLASKKRILRINGNKIVKDNDSNEYESEKEFADYITFLLETKWNGMKRFTNSQIIKHQIEFLCLLNLEKDLEPVYTINGFSFSKALCDTCYDTEKETLKKIADAMNYCITPKFEF